MTVQVRTSPFLRWALMIITVKVCLSGATFALAAVEEDDLARLQGTWRVVSTERDGVSKPMTSELLYVFSESRLYRKSKVNEAASTVVLDTSKSPKWMDETGFLEDGHKDKTPVKIIYKFDGDSLLIANSRQPWETRPKSFDTANDKTTASVTTLKKVSNNTAIPEHILKWYKEPSPIKTTENKAAEAVLRQVLVAFMTGEPVEKIRPLIINGTDDEIRELTKSKPTVDELTAITRGLAEITIRDIQLGERLIYADGSELLVEERHLGPNATLLMMVEDRVDQGFFALSKMEDHWKVDLSSLLREKRQASTGRRVFEGVRLRMTFARVQELLLGYKETRNYKSYSVSQPGDGTIVVECDDGIKRERHIFTFVDRKLARYTTTPQ